MILLFYKNYLILKEEMYSLDDILNADKMTDLFPQNLDSKEAKIRYQKCLRISHPDVNPNRTADAEKAFQKVTDFWNEHLISQANLTSYSNNGGTITTKTGHYIYNQPRYLVDGVGFAEIQKFPTRMLMFATRSDNTNAFVETLQNLKKVTSGTPVKEYYPTLLESFLFSYKGSKVAGALLEVPYEFKRYYTLRDILIDYPEGLDSQKVAWVYLNILKMLQGFENVGLVHSGAYIDSFLINPSEGKFLVKDWHYSVRNGNYPRLLNREAVKHYPSEVAGVSGVTALTDLVLSARACLLLLNDEANSNGLSNFLQNASAYPSRSVSEQLQLFTGFVEENFGILSNVHFNMRRV